MYRLIKRVSDFLVALILLLLLSPILIPIVIGLRLTGEGEILYKQNRIGHNQQRFDIYKFATMLKNSPNIGTGSITLRNDPRVTPMGEFLRSTKINELPQLLNILIGNMSLVGPRPLMPVSFALYNETVQNIVYQAIPGITGLGSLVYRDEEALVSEVVKLNGNPQKYYAQAVYPYKGQLEIYYNIKRGFITDCKILVGTALSLVDKKTSWANKFFNDLPARPENLTPRKFVRSTV